jgi:hypothetical protein
VIRALVSPRALKDRSFWLDGSHLRLVGERERDFQYAWPTHGMSSDRAGSFSPIFAF